MRESFVFYKSFYDAIKQIPEEYQLELYNAILQYSLEGIEPSNLSNIASAMFTLIKPNIDNAQKRYETSVNNGKKGGRPKKEKPNKNLNETQEKPNENLNVNDNVNDNDNVNVNIEEDYKKYIKYLGIEDERKFPRGIETQIQLYKNAIKLLLQQNQKQILNSLDIMILSRCWEKFNQAKSKEKIKDELLYFIEILKNEVKNYDDRGT